MANLGIDIGGTGIKMGIVDEVGRVLHRVDAPTNATEGPDEILQRIAKLTRPLLNKRAVPVLRCGVGLSGRVDNWHGHVVLASGNLPGWTGRPVAKEMSALLDMPVTIDNDVNVAAIAEGWVGSARGIANYVMITVGTGIGGGLVVGGRLWRGAQWGAGEVGHMVLHPGGLACACGGHGCVEQYISSRALTRRANEALGEQGPSFRGVRDVISAIEQARQPHEEAARAAVEEFAKDMALFLMNLQQAFDPQMIIIGGGIIRLGYWWERMNAAVEQLCGPRSLSMRVRRAFCGPYAGVVGAARLAMLLPSRP